MQWVNQRAQRLQQGAIRAMFDRSSKMENVISMGIGEPDMATPPLICRACEEALRQGMTHYTPNAGMLALRQAIAEKSTVRSCGYDPETEIIVTNGGMGALSLLFMVILEPGDEVLIQDPQWLNYAVQVECCGGTAVRVPTTMEQGFLMQAETVEQAISPKTKALIINSPSNPTGEVIDEETLKKLAEIAVRHDLLVISDEVYNTLLYDHVPFRSIAELPGMKERTVVVNSFSKSYAMTGWRIGYLAGPRHIVDRMTKWQENFNACANAPGQYAAVTALDHPELSEELRLQFAARRTMVLEQLNQIPGLRYHKPQGAFYVFPDIRAYGLSSAEFCNRLLDQERVVCIPGSAFGACGEGFIRMSYTSGEEQLEEAIRRLKRFCDSLC